MKIIKIQGVREDIAVIRNSLSNLLIQYPIFILNSEKPLYKFLEDIEVDDSILFRLKIAKEIDFDNIEVMLKDKITENTILGNVKSLSDLLKNIDESIIKDCKLIIDTEDNSLISEVIQALIYLNVELEVMMKKEKINRKLLDVFTGRFEKIRASVVNGKEAVYNLDTKNGFLYEKDTLARTFHEIEDYLDKARERNLTISVMATKKAGKSVVVNSFINEQYAPTSLELPTPNICIYKKSRDENIRLLYRKSNILFKNAAEVYRYIYNEFKKAQSDRDNKYTLDDMEIHYTNSNSDFASFNVVDTPGSNYALAKDIESGENRHRKIAYEWIQKSDVVLFLINYSNYLSMDEEEFFRKIKSEFEKHDKFYSLVVVVNKLDEIFLSECENKSFVRFLDYIRCKLIDLGYKSFVVMGTSARSYFDIIKVSRLDSNSMSYLGETVPIEKLRGPKLRARLKALKRRFIGKNEMSALSFVDDQLEKLECFYGLEDYDLYTLRQKSGMPSLLNYTKHVSTQKAYVEVYGLLLRSIDEKYVRIKNISIINNLMDSQKDKSEQVEEIKNMLKNIMNTFNHIQLDMEKKLSFEEFRTNLLDDIRSLIEKRLKYAFKLCESRFDEVSTKLALKSSQQLGMIKNKVMDIDLSISNKALNEELYKIVDKFLRELNSELEKKQEYIMEAEGRMRGIIETASFSIRKEYELKSFNIDIPKVDPGYRKLLAVKLPETYNIDDAIKEKIIDSIEVRGSIVGKLANYFINNRFGYYSLNGRQLQSIKEEYMVGIKNNLSMQYYSLHNSLRTNLITYLDSYTKQIDECFKRISDTYQSIITDVLKDLTDSKANIENQLDYLETKLQFFKEVDRITKDFMNEWSMVRDSSV